MDRIPKSGRHVGQSVMRLAHTRRTEFRPYLSRRKAYSRMGSISEYLLQTRVNPQAWNEKATP